MKKNKLFILFSIITLIFIFGLAATCNLCGAPITIGGTDEAEAMEAKEDSVDKEIIDSNSSQEGTDSIQESEASGENTAEGSSEDDLQEGEAPDNNEGQEQPQEEIEEQQIIKPAIYEETGTVIENMDTFITDNVVLGDNDSNAGMAGFISFDISELSNATVSDAILVINKFYPSGDISFYNSLFIGSYDWGDGLPGGNDLFGAATKIQSYEITPQIVEGIYCSNVVLLEEVQKAIDGGKSKFRLKVTLTGDTTDKDNIQDSIMTMWTDLALNIWYLQ